MKNYSSEESSQEDNQEQNRKNLESQPITAKTEKKFMSFYQHEVGYQSWKQQEKPISSIH